MLFSSLSVLISFLFYLELILANIASSINQYDLSTGISNDPYLNRIELSNVTTQISTAAYLPCKVIFYILFRKFS